MESYLPIILCISICLFVKTVLPQALPTLSDQSISEVTESEIPNIRSYQKCQTNLDGLKSLRGYTDQSIDSFCTSNLLRHWRETGKELVRKNARRTRTRTRRPRRQIADDSAAVDPFFFEPNLTLSFSKEQLEWWSSLSLASVRNRSTPLSKIVRKEYRQLTDDERNRFHKGLQYLKETKIGNLSRYDIFTRMHQFVHAPGAHSGPAFLAWHREFLRRYVLIHRSFSLIQ